MLGSFTNPHPYSCTIEQTLRTSDAGIDIADYGISLDTSTDVPQILVTSTFNKLYATNHLNIIFEAKLSFPGGTGSNVEVPFEFFIFLNCAARTEYELVTPFE